MPKMCFSLEKVDKRIFCLCSWGILKVIQALQWYLIVSIPDLYRSYLHTVQIVP